jgi:hypothetical protein
MLTFVASSFVIYLHAHTLPDTQLSKVGKTEKSEPAVFGRKSRNQRGYEDVRWPECPPRRLPKGQWRAIARSAEGRRLPRGSAEAIAQGAVPEAIAGNISSPVWLKQRGKKLKSI